MTHALTAQPDARVTQVLKYLEISPSSWYRRCRCSSERARPGPKPKPIADAVVKWVVEMATNNPWYGYKKIAVLCRRAQQPVKNREAYRVMKLHGLLRKRQPRKAEIHQTAKLFELLPCGPNQLWQMDVTYVHIAGYGWWYAVTVIDYFSRYSLAVHLVSSYCASEILSALQYAREEAERLHGPLTQVPVLVTDNGPSFIARRFRSGTQEQYQHVRIQYRTPTQLGLLERFHQTLKDEEVYWQLYEDPTHARRCLEVFKERYNNQRPHWALVPPEGGDPVTPLDVYVKGVAVGIPKWQSWAKAAKAKLDGIKNAA